MLTEQKPINFEPTTRTYGTYSYMTDPAGGRGFWELKLEPATAMRVKRILGRVRSTRTGAINVWDSPEIARDLEWICERWELAPATLESAQRLSTGAARHRAQERAVTEILGGQRRLWLPRDPAKTPRDYQLTAVELLRATGRLLLTDSVGLGKTFTGLLNAVHEDALPLVVVPPTHLPSRWEQETRDAFPWLTVQTAKKASIPTGWNASHMPDVLIVPYSRLHGWADYLDGVARTVVFDEVQELRNGVSTRKGAAAAQLTQNAAYVLGLTATPVYNYGGEVWEILDILAQGELGSREEFTREWGYGMNNGKVFIKDPAALGGYLREQGLMLGRTRKDVGRELPDYITVPMTIDSNPDALESIKGDARRLAQLILADTTSSKQRMEAGGELSWKLREATGIGKAPFVAEFARLLLESEKKIILFGWHRAVYDIWMDALAEFGPKMITGSESATQKDAARQAFIDPLDANGRGCRVLIMSLRAGAGVDGLQDATNVVVFGELDWSPQVHHQGIGRAHRDRSPENPNQEPVVAYYLHSEDGSDPVLLEMLGVKINQAEPMVNVDGKLTTTKAPELGRARLLAKNLLGIK